jgi:hypothetical protein
MVTSSRLLRSLCSPTIRLQAQSAAMDNEKPPSPPASFDEVNNGSTTTVSVKNMSRHKMDVDGDEALRGVSGGGPVEIDAATNERIKRKIDWMLMPVRRSKAISGWTKADRANSYSVSSMESTISIVSFPVLRNGSNGSQLIAF